VQKENQPVKKNIRAKIANETSGRATQTGETAGLDLGDKVSRYCLLNEEGRVIEEGTFRNTESSIQKCFGQWGRTRIALETGTQSGWISRLLSSYGHEVIVAHARELRGITHSNRKNDRNDAEKLARYARLDPELLHPVQHRNEQQQADLTAVRARDALVRARTLLVNAARGLAKVHGERLPPTVTKTFGRRAQEKISLVLLYALRPLLAQIDQLTHEIEHYDSLIERIAEARYPETVPLRSIPSIGPITSLTFVLTLGDRQRFTHSRDVGAYLGLQPKQQQSGEHDPQLGITKAGNSYLRKLLVQCAHYTLGHFACDSQLRQWGLGLAERGGKNAKKRAIVAVARKLAVLLHRLWVTGETYQPFLAQPQPSQLSQ
jgi:transposase